MYLFSPLSVLPSPGLPQATRKPPDNTLASTTTTFVVSLYHWFLLLTGKVPSFLSRFVIRFRLGSTFLFTPPTGDAPPFGRRLSPRLLPLSQLIRKRYQSCTSPSSGTEAAPSVGPRHFNWPLSTQGLSYHPISGMIVYIPGSP